ncbi:hypothetical protein J4Q44_G00222070 [Coregonus suidteri]|uniref:Uncharacterized protein n=1 Tax=Coregonus suidteri TaxID=861788 RepID=A0AAN8L959_9TELE
MDCEDSASLSLPYQPDPEPTVTLGPDCNSGAQCTLPPLALLLEDCINLLGPNAESMKLEEDCEDSPSLSLPHQPDPISPLKRRVTSSSHKTALNCGKTHHNTLQCG